MENRMKRRAEEERSGDESLYEVKIMMWLYLDIIITSTTQACVAVTSMSSSSWSRLDSALNLSHQLMLQAGSVLLQSSHTNNNIQRVSPMLMTSQEPQ